MDGFTSNVQFAYYEQELEEEYKNNKEDNMSNFNKLLTIDVNDKVEKKNGLSYLSWAWAWAEFKKTYPDATYQVRTFDGKPYIYDDILGYMVMTSITANGETLEMWLPAMDGANKSLKDDAYEYSTKYGKKRVEQCSMFDINKTIMRCLVKNIAMFGLGLYIYAGEDLPEDTNENKEVIDPDIDIIEGLKSCADLNTLKLYYQEHKDNVKDLKKFNKLTNELKAKLGG